MALFAQQHGQELVQIKNDAERAFGPDQKKWTYEQVMAYVRALNALYEKYHPQSATPAGPTVVNIRQERSYTPYTPPPAAWPTPMPITTTPPVPPVFIPPP